MAISTRTLITSPAALAVAAWTVFGVGLMATHYSSPTQIAPTYSDSCKVLADSKGETSTWGEYDWFEFVQCVDQTGDTARAAGIANLSTTHYPKSELLVNQAGILFIKIQDYHRAENVLLLGARQFRPTTGTLYNNLAWASMFTGNHQVELLRRWYGEALRLSPNSCEILHTGLMVEWRAAEERTSNFDLRTAVGNFTSVYDRYERCTQRSTNDESMIAAERLTALVAAKEVDKAMHISFNMELNREFNALTPALERMERMGVNTERMICKEIPTTLNRSSCHQMVGSLLRNK